MDAHIESINYDDSTKDKEIYSLRKVQYPFHLATWDITTGDMEWYADKLFMDEDLCRRLKSFTTRENATIEAYVPDVFVLDHDADTIFLRDILNRTVKVGTHEVFNNKPKVTTSYPLTPYLIEKVRFEITNHMRSTVHRSELLRDNYRQWGLEILTTFLLHSDELGILEIDLDHSEGGIKVVWTYDTEDEWGIKYKIPAKEKTKYDEKTSRLYPIRTSVPPIESWVDPLIKEQIEAHWDEVGYKFLAPREMMLGKTPQ